jgi:hypothetical protein
MKMDICKTSFDGACPEKVEGVIQVIATQTNRRRKKVVLLKIVIRTIAF